MKLSNTQIYAIIDEVATVAQKKLDDKNKKLKADLIKSQAPLAKKYYKMYMDLPEELRKIISPYDRVKEAEILSKLTKVEDKIFNRSKLKNQIILASIDSKDLEELKTKLKLEF